MKFQVPQFAAAILVCLFSLWATAASAETSTARTKTQLSSKKNHQKKSKFDPSSFLQRKQQATATGAGDAALDAKARTEALTTRTFGSGNFKIVCKSTQKPAATCTGFDCESQNAPVDPDLSAPADPLINDTTRLTKELMKTIRENCVPVEENKPHVKPIVEVEIKDSAAGPDQAKEVTPKIGLEATF